MSRIVEIQTTTVVAIVTNNYLLRLGLQKIVDDEKWIRLVGQAAHAYNLDEILTTSSRTLSFSIPKSAARRRT
jgi:hypothetical protein